MNKTTMKINATDRVLSVARPHREPMKAPTNTTGIRMGMRTYASGQVKPVGRSARPATYAAKPTAAVGMMSNEDVPIAFRVFRPRTYTRSGTFTRPRRWWLITDEAAVAIVNVSEIGTARSLDETPVERRIGTKRRPPPRPRFE